MVRRAVRVRVGVGVGVGVRVGVGVSLRCCAEGSAAGEIPCACGARALCMCELT